MEACLALLNHVEEGICILDPEGNLVEANDSFCRMLGYVREEMKGMNCSFREFMPGGVEGATFETKHRRKDGTFLDVEVSVRPIFFDGKPALFLSSRNIAERKRVEFELQFYSEITLNAATAIVAVRMDGTIHYVNRRFGEMFGYSSGELLGKSVSLVNAPTEQSPEEVAAGIMASLERDGRWSGEILNLRKDGSSFWTEAHISSYLHPEFGTLLISHQTDISDRKRDEKILNDFSREIEDLYNHAPCGYHSIDAEGRIVRINQTELDWLGYRREEVIGRPVTDFLAPASQQAVRDILEHFKKEGHVHGAEREIVRKDGATIHVQIDSTAIYDDEGKFLMSRTVLTDISDRKDDEARIQQLAYYDQLTALPNRRLFRDRLEQDVLRVKRNNDSLALLFLDLDRFKEVNDTFGHDKGDMLLVEAARRVRQHVREMDTFARLAGDEFTIILPEYERRSAIDRVVQSVLHELALPFDLGEGDVGNISCSIGISLYPEDAKSVEDLLKHADQAMYEAKLAGRNGFTYFAGEAR